MRHGRRFQARRGRGGVVENHGREAGGRGRPLSVFSFNFKVRCVIVLFVRHRKGVCIQGDVDELIEWCGECGISLVWIRRDEGWTRVELWGDALRWCPEVCVGEGELAEILRGRPVAICVCASREEVRERVGEWIDPRRQALRSDGLEIRMRGLGTRRGVLYGMLVGESVLVPDGEIWIVDKVRGLMERILVRGALAEEG